MKCNPEKKRGKSGWFLFVAYRFLSIRMITSPMTTIAIMMPIDTGRKYRSAAEAGTGVASAAPVGVSNTER